MIILIVTLLFAYCGFLAGELVAEIHTYGIDYVVNKTKC